MKQPFTKHKENRAPLTQLEGSKGLYQRKQYRKTLNALSLLKLTK
ncbi:hypothetical protein [Chryseobacterium sp. Leaf201]|nr:hypothetical protein [Chryseobacterium sp. Leaf201]